MFGDVPKMRVCSELLRDSTKEDFVVCHWDLYDLRTGLLVYVSLTFICEGRGTFKIPVAVSVSVVLCVFFSFFSRL